MGKVVAAPRFAAPRNVDDFDDEEDRPRRRRSASTSPRVPIMCPECGEKFSLFEEMAPHIERHREVGRPVYSVLGRLRSNRCPKGCGRWFSKVTGSQRQTEFKHHVELCDGSPPIPLRNGQKLVEEEKMSAESRMIDIPKPYVPKKLKAKRIITHTCPKCLKGYERGGARFDKHVDKCDGLPMPARGNGTIAKRRPLRPSTRRPGGSPLTNAN